jgi:hypothetical protein
MQNKLPVLPGLIFALTGGAIGGFANFVHNDMKHAHNSDTVLAGMVIAQVYAFAVAFIGLGVVWMIVAGVAKLCSKKERPGADAA